MILVIDSFFEKLYISVTGPVKHPINVILENVDRSASPDIHVWPVSLGNEYILVIHETVNDIVRERYGLTSF